MKTLVVLATVATLFSLGCTETGEKPAEIAKPAVVQLKTFIIERNMPGAGELSAEELKEASAKSNEVLAAMGGDAKIKWINSYVTGDKLYCHYQAENADMVREHAEAAGFPSDSVSEVRSRIDPTTGGAVANDLLNPPEGLNTYVIEREMPDVGQLSADELRGASETSNGVLAQMEDIQWVHSYVTDDKMYCVYHAKNEDLVREHAESGGFPANSVSQVFANIDPSTGI